MNDIKNLSDIELAMEFVNQMRNFVFLKDEELDFRCDHPIESWSIEDTERNKIIVRDILKLKNEIFSIEEEIRNRFEQVKGN